MVKSRTVPATELSRDGAAHRNRNATAARIRPQSDAMSGYDTNLAAEYYVLACLHRIGLTANLTLGNKKGVDVVVVRNAGDAVSVEVKGIAKKYDWPANNLVTTKPGQHFVALVSFEGRISDREMPAPRAWIVPFPDVERFKRSYPGGRPTYLERRCLRTAGDSRTPGI